MVTEPEELARNFGRAIQRRRAELGISQETLSQRSKLHRTYICDVERGARNLSIKNVQRLANALEIPGWQLFYTAEQSCELVAASAADQPEPTE